MKPMIMYSDMTDRWYIVTRYKDLGEGKFRAQTKYDVTDQMQEIITSIQKGTNA